MREARLGFRLQPLDWRSALTELRSEEPMNSALDDYPRFASAIRRLFSAGVSASDATHLMACIASESKCIPLAGMDDWERAIRAEIFSAERDNAKTPWKLWAHERRFTSWLELCCHDGRRREAALRVTSGGAPSAFLLALALRRLNDWVPQVRNAARETLPQLVSNSEPQDVATVLWSLLAHWDTWGRMESPDRETVAAITSSEPVALALGSRIMATAAGPAGRVLAQCARSETFDRWIEDFAYGAVQPAVRAVAFRWLLSEQVTWVTGRRWLWTDLAYCKGKFEPVIDSRQLQTKKPFLATLRGAMADSSPMVRRVAAEFLIRQLPSLGEHALLLAKELASDASQCVAWRGEFALKQLHQQKHEGQALS